MKSNAMTKFRMSRSRVHAFLGSLIALAAIAAPASAQLEPVRFYHGLNRAIEMTVTRPGGERGDLKIALLEAGTARVVDVADVDEGPVDLSLLFPRVWNDEFPQLYYAQLMVNETKVGPAVIVRPLVTPQYAVDITLTLALVEAFQNNNEERFAALMNRQHPFRRALGREAEVEFPALQDWVYSGVATYADRHVIIGTSEGEIEIRLRPEFAPNTCWNFIDLVEKGFYRDMKVDRVIVSPKKFLIQFGDPTGTEKGTPGYYIDLEPSSLPHDFGTISMARDIVSPDANGSQIFICLSREGGARLDSRYTSFAEVVRGADVIVRMENVELGGPRGDMPQDVILISDSWTVPAPPYGEGPEPVTRPAVGAGPR